MRVAGAGLAATIDPRRGAKITSLIDVAGTEWLSQGAADASTGPGLPFVEAEMRGWDECAPTINACVVDGRALPDHGDLWDIEFEAEGDRVSATGPSVPYRFERRISATATGLRLDYSAEALESALPFLWAAHPQFAAPPETRVELPSSVEEVVDVMDAATPRQPWTPALASIDTVPEGGCRKVYVAPETRVERARLVRPDGSTLDIRWSPECPYLGIWFDAGAYSAVPVIALEPATAYYDSLELAVRLQRAPVLEPGVPLTWWVELEAHPAG
ncbi:hypothetical protein [Microbacterium sp. P5_E9]